MNDHNLDDLIIDNIELNKNKKSNSLLTIVALSIIVLIVAIILTKVILKDPEVDQIKVKEDHTELVSPDLTLEPQNETDEEISAPVPVPTQEENTVEKQEEPALEPAPIPEATEESTVQPTVSPEIKEETIPQPVPEPVKVEPKIEPIKEVKKPEEPKTVKVPEKTVEKVIPKPDTRPANVITRPEEKKKSSYSLMTMTYYIQVGSFRQPLEQTFINKTKNNGFQYKVVKSKNGIKKVLVGPYPDRQSVDKALIQVRKRIAKDAFVYKK